MSSGSVRLVRGLLVRRNIFRLVQPLLKVTLVNPCQDKSSCAVSLG
ncbi:MAG: hypothetical protein M2R45_01893 [Verrucomicrobia subdivision 3 bacterium]|nr:hypothetical protein [Limisphaerales bacterium]